MKKKLFLAAGLFSLTFNISAQQELIQNGSFEFGEQGWDFSSSNHGYAEEGGCPADDGQNYLWFGDFDESTGLDDLYEVVSQKVLIPANLDFAEFSFRWSGTSDEQEDIEEYDFLFIEIYDENGEIIFQDEISNADLNPLLTVGLCDDWYGGVAFTIESQYAGQEIEVVFAAETDEGLATIFRIDAVSILAQTTAGLSENNISNLQISPNPATDQIQINNLNNSDSQISIFNSAGKEIYSQSLKSGINTINISNLTPGFYIVKEQNGAVSKIVKQ